MAEQDEKVKELKSSGWMVLQTNAEGVVMEHESNSKIRLLVLTNGNVKQLPRT